MEKGFASCCLVIVNVNREFFGNNAAIQDTQKYFGLFGKVESLVPIPSFGRLLVLFEETQSAINAKKQLELEKPEILGDKIAVYFVDYFPSDEEKILEVPAHKRNFLISPPGSPMADWQQIQEFGPSNGGFLEDIHRIEDVSLTIEEENQHSIQFKNSDRELPTILIQDFDFSEPVKPRPATLPRTSRPPARQGTL